MASNADQPSSPDSSQGSAADELTPPTMKFGTQASSSGTENTIKVTQGVTGTGGAKTMPTTARTQASKTVSNITGDYTETLSAGIETQELVNDPLLLAAPRVDYKGQQVPCLNGIPMLAMIGRGGMGAVYYGVHPRLRSEVAVKVLPFHLAEQDQGMIRRFFREAQIAAQVRSPHLVNVMDVNEEAGLFFLVMEFVPGRTAGQYLKQCIEKSAPVSEANMLDLVIAATEGLWAAHSAGVIHRDIKPENIMVPYSGRGSKEFDLRRAKLMDLGLARSEESNQSLTGNQAAMGTPGYMAPEQAMDAKTADKRSDVFSMGATIYAMMYGKAPFRGETVMKILMATMHEPHEPLIKVRPDVSPVINEIVERCLAKKQEHRFGDAKQLLNALEECKRLANSGQAGSMPTPGTFAYRPESGATPGSSTNATQMGLPTTTGSGPQTGVAGKKSKSLMIAGGGAAAVLAAGIAFFALKPDNKPLMSPDEKKVAMLRFENETKLMDDIFAKSDKEQEASFATLQIVSRGLTEGQLGQLASIDPTYKTKVEEYAKRVQGVQNYSELVKKVNALEAYLNSENLAKFKELEPEASKLATDKRTLDLLEKSRQRARAIEARLATAARAKDLGVLVRKLVADGKLEAAQQEFDALKTLAPDNKDLPQLAKMVRDLEETNALKAEVTKLTGELKAKQEANDYESAYNIAQILVGKDTGNAAYYAKVMSESSDKLGAEVKKKQAEETQARIGLQLKDAAELQKKGDLEQANRVCDGILAIDKENVAAKTLKETIGKALIERERSETRRLQRERADENFAKVQQQLDDPNGDMEYALKQLDLGREETKTDLEYQKKAEVLAAGIAKKSQQQKNMRDADENVRKANNLLNEKSLAKLREGEDLAKRALELVPDHPGALTAAATFAKKSAEAFKAMERDKETHNKLIAEGESRLGTLTGKSLADQIQILELAQRNFDDAKSMQTDSPGAKLSTETGAKLKAVREQYVTQKKIEGIVATADGVAARGNFDDAVKALDTLLPLDKDLHKKKVDDYGARKARAEQVIATELQKIQQKAAVAGQLDLALSDAQTLYNANSTRTELGSIVSSLSEASRIDRTVRTELGNFRAKVAAKTTRLKGTGATQLATAEAALNTYSTFVAARVKTYADGGFKDANFAQALASEELTQRSAASSAVNSYDYVPEPVQRRQEPDPVPEVPGANKRRQNEDPQPEVPSGRPSRRRQNDDPGIDGR